MQRINSWKKCIDFTDKFAAIASELNDDKDLWLFFNSYDREFTGDFDEKMDTLESILMAAGLDDLIPLQFYSLNYDSAKRIIVKNLKRASI